MIPDKAWRLMQLAVSVEAPCVGPASWRWTHWQKSVQDDAAARCIVNCPIVLVCNAYATQNREIGGTWGGVAEHRRNKQLKAKGNDEQEQGIGSQGG